jgi:transcriptional regulator with XRE-family HTH domain
MVLFWNLRSRSKPILVRQVLEARGFESVPVSTVSISTSAAFGEATGRISRSGFSLRRGENSPAIPSGIGLISRCGFQLKYSYIGAVERGTRNISLDSLEKIIIALDTDYGVFFDLTGVDVASDYFDKRAVLEVHNQFLRESTIDEIKLIHKISKDILQKK